MDHGQTFALLMVGMIMSFSIIRAKLGITKNRNGDHVVADDRETRALRDEIRALRERVATLETIATDRSTSLDREIERLRHR